MMFFFLFCFFFQMEMPQSLFSIETDGFGSSLSIVSETAKI